MNMSKKTTFAQFTKISGDGKDKKPDVAPKKNEKDVLNAMIKRRKLN